MDKLQNQTKCAIELYNGIGKENVTSYSENGLSESYEKAGISKDLLNEANSDLKKRLNIWGIKYKHHILCFTLQDIDRCGE